MPENAAQSLAVAINTHLLSGEAGYRRAGVHRYIYSLLRHLGETNHGLRLTAMAGQSASLPAGNYTVVRASVPTHRAPVRIAWEQTVQPRLLRQIGADVVHGPVYVGPIAPGCPLVVTVHDLSFMRHPELLRSGSRLYLTVMTRLSARRARRFIAVSSHTAHEASDLLGIPLDRIDVVYHGVDAAYRPLPGVLVEEFRRRHGLPERYILYLGTLEPRKNLLRLTEAFARAAINGCWLVLAGGKGWEYEDLAVRVEALGLGDRVVFPGFIAEEDLPFLYNGATVFAYPSLYEGFGLPVLEAMSCGTPVLTSRASALPEVAGDASLLVDPSSVEEIASGLSSLCSDTTLRHEMRDRGIARAKRFSWRTAARETAYVYQRAAGRSAT